MNASFPAQGATYHFRHRSCDLVGRLVGEGIVLTAGSSARAESRPGASETILVRRSRLVSEGVAAIEGDRLVLQHDHVLASPAQAADLMNGGHVREPLKLWQDVNGRLLKDIHTNE